MPPPERSGPDPGMVARTVEYLSNQDDRTFAASLGDTCMTRIKEPQPEDFKTQDAYRRELELAEQDLENLQVEQAAFRSPALVARSLAAARFLLDDQNARLRAGRREGETKSEWAARQRRIKFFILNVGRERRLLEGILNGLRAQSGILPNNPNPRQRAMEELARRHSKEFLQLVRHQERLQKERRAEQRRQQKLAAKEAKRRPPTSGGAGPPRQTVALPA